MTKKKLPALSPAETEILALVWKLGQATVQNVCDNLPVHRRITYPTVQTLLRRLEKKGYLDHQSNGKAYLYHSAIRKDDVIRRTVGDFVERLFGGDPVPLMLHLAQRGDLRPEDIERLKKLVNKTNP